MTFSVPLDLLQRPRHIVQRHATLIPDRLDSDRQLRCGLEQQELLGLAHLTHGAQQLTFFNGHYDCWCYLPLLAFLTFDDETEQYLCVAILRPGNVPASRGARGLLRRLIDLLRIAFPKARFLVRLDGGFATPEIFDVLDAEPRVDYVVAMAENAVLTQHAEPAMVQARAQSEASGETEHVYTEARYAARTWPHDRRVVIKAEVVRLPGRPEQRRGRCVDRAFALRS